MLKPTKGHGIPLEFADFWNLAGRAGRLRYEFQGNIFLIDYETWRRKPLMEAKDADITPGIEKSIKSTTSELIAAIDGKGFSGPQRTKINIESAFVRLYDDYKSGQLEKTFQQLDVDDETKLSVRSALERAGTQITLPAFVLKGRITYPHIGNKDFTILQALLLVPGHHFKSLIPLHPSDDNSFLSYANALKLCTR